MNSDGNFEIVSGDSVTTLTPEIMADLRMMDFREQCEKTACRLILEAMESVISKKGAIAIKPLLEIVVDRKKYNYVHDFVHDCAYLLDFGTVNGIDLKEIATCIRADLIPALRDINNWCDHHVSTSVLYAEVGRIVEWLEWQFIND